MARADISDSSFKHGLFDDECRFYDNNFENTSLVGCRFYDVSGLETCSMPVPLKMSSRYVFPCYRESNDMWKMGCYEGITEHVIHRVKNTKPASSALAYLGAMLSYVAHLPEQREMLLQAIHDIQSGL